MAVAGGPSAPFRAEINVSEFLGTLKKLESDKVTERKVAQTDLKRILDRDEWLDFIDECSHVANPKGKGRTQLASVTWERLVSAASGVALRDYEAQKRNAKREYPGVLFKVVIRAGNRRAPQIALKLIVDHIVQVLHGSSPEMRQCFAVEYSNILLKDVLVYREYRNALACGSMYKDLILLYCEMYSSPVCQVDRSLLAAVLEKLVLHGALRTNLPLDCLFRFLKSSLANVLHERNTKSIEGLLALANTFFTVSGANTRRRICALGEPLLNGLIGMWSRCQPAVRRELLVFLRLQLVVHFPRGRMAGSGAWAVDWEVMKKSMIRLHQTLLEELDSMAFKLRWSSKGETLFDRDLIELAADTFRVVNCMLSSDTESPCPPVGKRPRQVALSGWDMFHEQLQRNQGNPSIVVWLQILSRVLKVWSGDFPLDDFTVVLEDLNRMLAEVKRPEVVSWTVKCFRSAAVCQGFNVKELKWKPHQVMTLADTWDLVWSTTVRILNVHSCEQEGFQLLTAMLKEGIALNMDHEIWKLFVSGFSPCSSWHVAFLAEYLRSSTFPEDCGPAIPSSSQQPTRFVLRNQLIKFLLPVEDFDETTGRGAKNGFHLHVRSCPMELANVLVALTQRSCSIVGVVTCSGLCQGEDRTGPFAVQGGSECSQIENLYLSSSFDDKPPRMTAIKPVSKPSSVHMEKPIAALSSSLLAQLNAVAMELLKPAECEGLSPPGERGCMLALAEQLQVQAYHCSLIVSCVYLLLLSNHEEGSSLTDHAAVQKVSPLLDSIVKGLNKKEWNEVESKNRHQLVTAILNNLIPMFSTMLCLDVPLETAAEAATVSGLLAARVPKGLVDVVGQITKGKWFPPSKDSQQGDVGGCSDSNHTFTSSTSSRNNDGFDLMEVEPRATATSVGRSSGDTTNTVKGMVEMDAPTSLDVYDKSSVCGVRLLVVWLRGALPSGGRGLQGPAVTAAHNVLLSMLSAESVNLSDPRCVHVVLCVAKLLECERIDRTDLETLLDGIRNLLTSHSRDPSVSTSCLTALQSSAHHLAALGDPSSEYSTELCQKFLSAFWMLNRDGQLSPKLRLKLVECLHAYLMVDPGSEWMVISERRRRKEREALPPGEATLAVTLKEAFLSFLKDNDHQVRMKVAHLIPVLFEPVRTGCTTTQFQPLPRPAQEALFADMKQAFSTRPDILLTELDSSSEDDETLNNMSSRLATFQSVMCVSSVCECPVLLMVLAALGRHLVELTAVDKMLCQVAVCLGYTTKEQFLEDHLVSMVTQWLTDGFSIEAFPCKLFGFDEVKDFLLKHSDVVVPVLVWRNGKEALRKLEGVCVCSSQDLLRGCLPRCMLVVLTTYASQKEGLPVDAAKKDQASACHDLLSEYFGEEELSSLLRESMDKFLVELLTCLYEDCNSSSSSSKYLKYFLPSDPELNPPHFSCLQVSVTLQYVAQCYGLHHSSLVATLSKTKDSLQSILLSLSLKLCRSHRSHTRRRLLVSYLLFVELIASDLQTGLGGSKLYLVHTIIHFALNCITSERERMKSHGSHMTIVETTETGKHSLMLCFDILKVIFDAAVSVAPQELGRHLPLVISSVLSAARDNLLALVSPLLDSLASSCSVPLLSSYLGRADPIPAEGGLRDLAAVQVTAKQLELGRSLQDDMVQVMGIDHRNTAVSPVDSLKQLRERMREEREETMKLIHADVMSEDHTTVVRLLQYLLQKGKEEASTEEDDRKNSVEGCAVVAECARCLGELGSVDLKQVALPDVNKIDDCASSLASLGLPPNEIHTARVLKYLCDLLVNKDIEVMKASCDSLKAILATSQGSKVLSQLEKMSRDPHLHWCQYLEPFTGRKKGKATATTHKWHDVVGEGNVAIGGSSLWNPWGGPERKEYGSWLTQLVLFLLRDSSCITDPVLLQLTPIASIKVEVCELVFPFIVYDALVNGGEDCRKALSDSFRVFFTAACCAPLEDSRPVLLMVRTIMYLRTVPRSNNNKKSRSLPTAWDNNFWLDVDYLTISKATQHCSLHLTSLLCLEIAVGEMEERGPIVAMGDEEPDGVASGCLAGANPVISSGPHANDIHSLLVDIYSNIGEPDGLYGVYSIFGSATSNRANKLKMFEHEGQWLRALGGYALEMNAPAVGSGAREGLVKALHSLGWHSLSEAHTSGGGRSSRTDELKNLKEYQFESAWRSTLWEEKEGDRPLPSAQALSTPSFAQCIFFGVEAIRHKSLFQLEESVMSGRSSVFASWLQAGECTSLLYPVMSKLQSLLEVEETAQVLARQRELQQLLLPWKQRLPMMDADYSHVEPVLSLRCVLLQLLLSHSTENVAGNGSGGGFLGGAVEELYSTIGATLLWQAELARKAGQYQLAESAIFSMSKLAPPPGVGEAAIQEVQWGQQLEESQLHWALGEASLALQTLRDTTQRLEKVYRKNKVAMQLYPRALCLYGSWLAETRTENPNVILTKYLQPAVGMIDTLSPPSSPPNCVLPPETAYITLARYADRQYQGTVHHMQSSTFEAKKELLRKSKKEAAELSKTAGDRSEASRHLRQLNRHSEEDQAELEALVEDRTRFLHIAVKNYILCLKAGDSNNLCVFRLCSLWFDNCNDKLVNGFLKESVAIVESRKFLPLLYQLAARLSKAALESDLFQQVLQEIILYTAKDHPHHSLYIVLAMGNAPKDDEYPLRGYICGSRKAKSRRTSTAGGGGGSHSVDEDKVQAARALVAKLRSMHGPLVRSTERLCEAYIELAYHDSSVDGPKNAQGLPLPINCALSKLGKLDGVAIPTLDVPVDPTCCYDNVIQIEGFDSSYMLAGGMNVPKVLSCIGSDGIRRRQLLKGRDDLRQDAVMQQVFRLVNQLLVRDSSAARRKLHIRTYNVVPLSQRSGIVEWCEGTVPLGEYLVHPRTGAHLKYHPHDWPSKLCRQKMESSKTGGRGDKLKVFKDVMSHFKPVFRHFFFEKFPSPSQWFERRLAYTRSVATSSIVGYIVGLGDRHVQNILVDTNSAEVIHIDLGVAFEQGRTLPTPEKVPFRLTRDIIDGMGVCGIEGVFRRCCEEILNTMKASREEVKTIVEVLLHDPLYMWTITPKKLLLVQPTEKDVDLLTALAQAGNTAGTGGGILSELDSIAITQKGTTSASKMAERALFRLQEKLDGYEDGIALSTSGQVNFLLQSATDIVNLSSLFPGWQAWV